jgi:hypothetical protein
LDGVLKKAQQKDLRILGCAAAKGAGAGAKKFFGSAGGQLFFKKEPRA